MAFSWTSRNACHVCFQIHSRTGRDSRSKPEGSKLAIRVVSTLDQLVIVEVAAILGDGDVAEKLAPAGAGVLFDDGEQVDERLDGVARRAEIGFTDAVGAMTRPPVQPDGRSVDPSSCCPSRRSVCCGVAPVASACRRTR